MTSIEAYNRFLLKINKVDTNTEIAILTSFFVLLYNSERLRWLSDKIKQKSTDSNINYISELLVSDYELNFNEKKDIYTTFNLLDDFFLYVSSISYASNDVCERMLFNYLIDLKNRNSYYEDEFKSLSFDWEETFVELSNNNLLVFTKDFFLVKVNLDYYRKPSEIDIDGYINSEGNESTNINLDLSDIWVNEIIDRCALEVIRQYENLQGFELGVDRINRET